MTKMAKIDAPRFMAKTAEKPYGFGLHLLIQPIYIREHRLPGAATFYNTVFLAEQLSQTIF